MKRYLLSILMIAAIFNGCSKNETPKTTGTDTIDNTLAGTASAGYYAYGFSFSQAKKVASNNTPKPDITFDNDGTLLNLILQTNNFKNSFYKVGEYASAALAEQAFTSLTSFTVPQWVEWGYQIKPNQIWLFMTSSEHYAKIRIISTVSETRGNVNYAECTFQWVYQPDGSLTFPGK